MNNQINDITINEKLYTIEKSIQKIYFNKGLDIYCYGKTNPKLYTNGFEATYKRKFKITGQGTFFNEKIALYSDDKIITFENITLELIAYDTEGLILSDDEKTFKDYINKGSIFYLDFYPNNKSLILSIQTSVDITENIIKNYHSNTELEIDIDANLFTYNISKNKEFNSNNIINELFILPDQNFNIDFLNYTMLTSCKDTKL